MNPFVDPNKRSITLPLGCKNLMDVLHQPSVSHDVKFEKNDRGLIITASGLHKDDLEILIEANLMRLTAKKAEDTPPVESCLSVPPGYDVSRAHASFYAGTLMIVIPKL